ncbi:MAG: DUF3313 domain-containing protein [Desulfarculaceae bacterium]|nr:DUF3313 domain-containing protein [Desulfarculaceae bacterium]MCF8072606.1 DUF3313 domain-containing protein [Desulfarculaceae bacterium]MCF8103322.1 DUF3313 domain-containing protein [Desulfarculaceae bacterium]MCF8117804.1 DUF3313 domain-containing protein [Desulfarculaceae bacterium]
MRIWRILLLVAVALSLAACQAPKSVQQGVAKPTSFLGPEAAAKLKPGKPGKPAWMYSNPKAKWASYDKMMLDPVTFWRKPGGENQDITPKDRQALANYFYSVIHKAMSQYLTMVHIPGPGTLRVQVAITRADPSVVALDVVSSVVPQAVALSTLTDAMTGKPAFVGEAAIACKVADARTGQLLASWVAERVGGKRLDQAQMSSWGDVQQAMHFWAYDAAYRLCKAQKRSGCQKPQP